MSCALTNLKTMQVAYVALGVARGHLMSAAVVRNLLLSDGYTVSVYTTSHAGRTFFEAVTGSAPYLLSGGFEFIYDDGHNLHIRRSIRHIVRYLLSRQLRGDIAQVRAAVASGALIINDIHPAPILLQRTHRRSREVALVNVLSEHSLGAVDQLCAGWLPGAAGRLGKATIWHLFTNCTHVIMNTLDPARFFHTEGNITFLPPIVEPAHTPSAQVRESLGVTIERPLFVAYLNPLFRRRELLKQLVDLAAHHEAFLYVVSESLAALELPTVFGQVRIVPYDFDFGAKIRAADLLISAAGIAAPIQAYAYGVPLVVLVTSQPEHRGNAATIALCGMGVPVEDPAGLPTATARALAYRPRPHAEIVEQTRMKWLAIIASASGR